MFKFDFYGTKRNGADDAELRPVGLKGFFGVFFGHFSRMVGANLLFIIFCIPVITIPAANCGLAAVAHSMSEDSFPPVFETFFKAFKTNFKTATVLGIPVMALYALFGFGTVFYIRVSGEYKIAMVPAVISIFALLMLVITTMYLYQMINMVDLDKKSTLKNSLLVGIVGLKRTAAGLAGYLIFTAGMVLIFPLSTFLLVLFGFGLYAFIADYACFGNIRQYIIDPYYEKNGKPDESGND